MDIEKMNELLEKVKNGKASKEEALTLLKAMNLSIETYKDLIEEVGNESN